MTWIALFNILYAWRRVILCGLGIIALAVLFWFISDWYVAYKQRLVSNALQHYNGLIINDQSQINALDAERERRKKEVDNAQTLANQAIDNANRVRRTDSSQFNADASAVRARFCRDYPDDSICR